MAKKQLMVVSSSGGRQRFLRGMITHSLMQRGLEFDEAYAMARAIRDRLADREEVTTAELRDPICESMIMDVRCPSPGVFSPAVSRPRVSTSIAPIGW
jgi:2-phosphoglycerate kinase